MRKYLLVTVICCLVNMMCFSQNPFSEDWKKIALKFNTTEYYLNMNYELFEHANSITPISSEVFVMQRKKEKLYYLMDSLEFILTEKIVFLVDHRTKTFMIQERTDEITKKYLSNANKFLEDFDEMSKNYVFNYSEINEQEGVYTYEGEISHYDKIALHFNPLTHDLIKMTYFFANAALLQGMPLSAKPVMQIGLTHIINDQRIWYKYQRFGDFKKNQRFVPSKKYSNYTVLNHLEK
jgi:hypothetical protein